MIPKRKLTQKNVDKLKASLGNVKWHEILICDNVNDNFERFHSTILSELDKIAPEKLVSVSTKQVINVAWMTPGLKKCSKQQLHLYKKSLILSSTESIEIYSKVLKETGDLATLMKNVENLEITVKSYGRW